MKSERKRMIEFAIKYKYNIFDEINKFWIYFYEKGAIIMQSIYFTSLNFIIIIKF